jgi:hypothetical protein
LHERTINGTIRCVSATGCAIALAFAAPAPARDTLGIFGSWGAFRDAQPARCFAIAQPDSVDGAGAGWKPFASVATWPALGQRNQLHLRLSRRSGRAAPVLIIDDDRFPLIASGAEAWALDAKTDSAIVATMRSARAMVVVGEGVGGAIRDAYVLKGAATAIDAAQLGCAKLR